MSDYINKVESDSQLYKEIDSEINKTDDPQPIYKVEKQVARKTKKCKKCGAKIVVGHKHGCEG